MFCLKCGKEIPAESAYCLYCGTKIPPLPAPVRADREGEEAARPSAPLPETAPLPWDAALLELPVVPTGSKSAPTAPPLAPPVPPLRNCTVCGRALPVTSISELCVTCLNNRSFVAVPFEQADSLAEYAPFPEPTPLPDSAFSAQPTAAGSGDPKASAFQLDLDLDADYPTAYAENPLHGKVKGKKGGRRKWPLIVLPVVIIAAGLMILLPKLLPKLLPGTLGAAAGADSSQSGAPSNLERKAIAYGREIAKASCANPQSVSFHKDATATQANEIWTVTETFDRTSRQGEFVTTTYTAVFRLDSSKDAGYVALKLRIDDTDMYDYTGK